MYNARNDAPGNVYKSGATKFKSPLLGGMLDLNRSPLKDTLSCCLHFIAWTGPAPKHLCDHGVGWSIKQSDSPQWAIPTHGYQWSVSRCSNPQC